MTKVYCGGMYGNNGPIAYDLGTGEDTRIESHLIPTRNVGHQFPDMSHLSSVTSFHVFILSHMG